MNRRGATAVTLLLVAGLPTTGRAQTPTRPSPATADRRIALAVGYEWHRDRLRYSFDSPSSFDTTFLVPHNYTQTYWADNHWLTAEGRYAVGGNVFTTEVGATASVNIRASDIDTFFNPLSDVVTSGTHGGAAMRSWRLAQWSHGRLAGMPLRLGYQYRRDSATFAPADIVVTHTNPPSTTRRFTTDEEYTTSQTHEVAIDVSTTLWTRSDWRLAGTAGVSPIVFARLTTLLPQKYPGLRIVSDARSAAFTVRLQAEHVGAGLPLTVGIAWGKSVSYEASRSFNRDALELSVGVGWR